MLSITIPAAALRVAFAILSKLTPGKVTLPVLGYIKAERIGRFVHLSATDLDLHARYAHPVEPAPITGLGQQLAQIRWQREAGAILVPRKTLADALKASKDGDITLAEGTIGYTLAGQAVTAPFDSIAANEFPDAPALIATGAGVLNTTDRAAILGAMPSISTDESRYILNGAYLECRNSDGKPVAPSVVATDGRRLYRHPLGGIAGIGANIVVPTGALKLLSQPALSAHDWTITIGAPPAEPKRKSQAKKIQEAEPSQPVEPCQAQFVAGPWTLTTKLIEGNFPNYRQVIPSDTGRITAEFDIATQPRVLQILGELPKGEAKQETVLLKFHSGRLEIVAAGSKITALVHGVNCDAPIAIGLNRYYLADVLAAGPGVFRLIDNMSALTYEAGKSVQVLMPMRCEGEGVTVPDAELESARARWEGKFAKRVKKEEAGQVACVRRCGLSIVADVKYDLDHRDLGIPLGALVEVPEPEAKADPVPTKRRGKKAA